MTPRLSVRAAARRLYEEMVEEGRASPQLGTRASDLSPQGGGEKIDLMAQVRALYEDTAAPVRDIARRAGITERTLYKYARKNNWKPRYAWTPDGARPPGRTARRRWSEAQEKAHARASQFAPVKGAGGRSRTASRPPIRADARPRQERVRRPRVSPNGLTLKSTTTMS